MQSDVKTFRGRTLEELLPKIREELGPEAIVLRRREGLAGGIGGFFQRSFVEVDARRGQPGELPLEARNDRATAEGLSAPGGAAGAGRGLVGGGFGAGLAAEVVGGGVPPGLPFAGSADQLKPLVRT